MNSSKKERLVKVLIHGFEHPVYYTIDEYREAKKEGKILTDKEEEIQKILKERKEQSN